MADHTKRDLREELDEINGDGRDGSDEFDVEPDDLSVEWREADPEARPDGMEWDPETGTVFYDVWSAQREALDALDTDGDIDIVALLAGFGTGKSVGGARWLIAQALEYPGGHFLAMGQTYSEAREATFKKVFAQLPGEDTTTRTSVHNGPETSPIVADYNRSQYRITLVNGSEITLGSADKAARFAGAEFGAVWLDEASLYNSDLHDLTEMIGSRLRGVEGPKRQFWTLTGNGYNDAYEILEQRQDASGEPIGLNIELIRASTLDNPYLDEGDKERFKRNATTGREEQALHGGFSAAQGLVYGDFQRDTHVIPHGEATARVDEWRVYGYDAGWNDPRVLLEIGRTPYGQLVVLDEFYESSTHVRDAIQWLTENDKPKETIVAEHEPADIEKFRGAGWPTERADKSLDAGISEVQRRLQDDGNAPVDETIGTAASTGANIVPPRSTKPMFGSSSSSRPRTRPSPNPKPASGGSSNGMTSPDPEPISESNSEEETETDDEVEYGGRVGLIVSLNCEHLIQEFLSYKRSRSARHRPPTTVSTRSDMPVWALGRNDHMTRESITDLLDDKTLKCPDCGEVFLRENALAGHRGSPNTDCSAE